MAKFLPIVHSSIMRIVPPNAENLTEAAALIRARRGRRISNRDRLRPRMRSIFNNRNRKAFRRQRPCGIESRPLDRVKHRSSYSGRRHNLRQRAHLRRSFLAGPTQHVVSKIRSRSRGPLRRWTQRLRPHPRTRNRARTLRCGRTCHHINLRQQERRTTRCLSTRNRSPRRSPLHRRRHSTPVATFHDLRSRYAHHPPRRCYFQDVSSWPMIGAWASCPCWI